ncbi:MAG: Gldg family protein, partial [Gammaproteobacteria bacterium]
VIEPEPFSVEEDRAVATGLQGIPINTAGDMAYFGLVGTNSLDNEEVIPFFQSNREEKLEYDLTKLIYNLANPEKRTIGILSQDLPVFGNLMPGATREWAISQLVSEFFEVKVLESANDISDSLDLLLVIHPKSLSDLTLFAIDQYLLGGGKAMIFVDPLAEGFSPQPDPENPYQMPVFNSSLEPLFSAWGIDVTDDRIAGDMNAAMRVQMRTERGIQEVAYLPWLRLGTANFNQEDFITSELNTINMGSAGIIRKQEDAAITVTPLFETSVESMSIESEVLQFESDPGRLLSDFESENTRFTLAARVDGNVNTAFPDGRPESDPENPFDEGFDSDSPIVSEGNLNVIVVADTDILNDRFWINRQNFLGMEMPQAIADNGNFVINALEVMSGSSDLISLRSRGEYSRPFEVVEEIRRDAEAQFRQRQQMLEARLEETEQKIAELQQQRTNTDVFLSAEQQAEIEKFRQEQVDTRQELRAVQHELQKNIE